MRNLPNIEPSVFRRGEYVGYAAGVWRITRSNSSYGTWSARHRDDERAPILYAFRLSDLSGLLARYAEDPSRYGDAPYVRAVQDRAYFTDPADTKGTI